MRYLGLDLGTKTLGLATSDITNPIATVYKTLYFLNEDYTSLIAPLKEIIEEYGITALVLVLPKNMDNTLGIRAETTLQFKELLEKELHLEVILMDERLTSVISNNILISADMTRKKRKKKVDGIAAQIILQDFLDRERNKENAR